jgi:hypothetical protein
MTLQALQPAPKAATTKASAGTLGPVVTRRLPQNKDHTVGTSPVAKRPSVRHSIETAVSNTSQAEFFKPDQTIILLDWDDTLCPSSWIRANKRVLSFFKPAPKDERFQRPLRELQRNVEVLLKLAMKLGSVVIVTNAQDPWVETSCRNFLPQLLPMIRLLPVIYARSIYETQCIEPARSQKPVIGAHSRSSSTGRTALPGLYTATGRNRLTSYNTKLAAQTQVFDELAPQRWKEVAFHQEITGFYSRYAHQSWKNILSIGDSVFERDAVRRVVLERPHAKKRCRTKTLKLFDDPDIEELIKQVHVIIEVMGMMVQYDGELDIEIDEEDLQGDMHFHDKIMR